MKIRCSIKYKDNIYNKYADVKCAGAGTVKTAVIELNDKIKIQLSEKNGEIYSKDFVQKN